MASPPSLPPPVIPQKRPSIASSQTSTASKRRSTTHPLRQTSFPAADATPFTPSDAGSVLSAAAESAAGPAGGGGRKRGRPKKNAQDQPRASGNGAGVNFESVKGSRRSPGTRGGRAGEQGDGGGSMIDGGEEDDDGDEYAGLDLDQIEAMNSEEVFKKQAEDQSKLQQALSPIQSDRFNVFKRTRFQPKTLKRIVNQVVSQSVTQTPLLAMNIALKWFTGEIVEQAVKVQEEMAEKWEAGLSKRLQREAKREKENERGKQATTAANGSRNANEMHSSVDSAMKGNSNDLKTDSDGQSPNTISLSPSSQSSHPPPRRKRPPPPAHATLSGHENPHRGGLLPEHLVEAVRRYRTNEDHGGVGFGGLSTAGLGVKGGKVGMVENLGMGFGRATQGGEVSGGRLFR